MKTVHYAMNISSTEAKLFTIRYGISQATQNKRCYTNYHHYQCVMLWQPLVKVINRPLEQTQELSISWRSQENSIKSL